eukprot:226110-Pleurochrysis_carterae.AAC.2
MDQGTFSFRQACASTTHVHTCQQVQLSTPTTMHNPNSYEYSLLYNVYAIRVTLTEITSVLLASADIAPRRQGLRTPHARALAIASVRPPACRPAPPASTPATCKPRLVKTCISTVEIRRGDQRAAHVFSDQA